MLRLTLYYSRYVDPVSSLFNPREIGIFFITCCCVFLRQKCLRALYSVDTTAITVMWSSLCKLSIDSVDMCFFQEEITDPAASEIPNSSTAITVETVSELDPFRKFRDIRHQDFGEIVFRKTKKSKKKANKGMFIKWIFPKPKIQWTIRVPQWLQNWSNSKQLDLLPSRIETRMFIAWTGIFIS